MATKEIKTKIALKYLDYTTWSAESFKSEKPLKGEVWFCAIPEGNANATTAPTMLFKVGDGVNTFGNLKWCSALAADVHTWAKKNEADFIEWVNTVVEHPAAPVITTGGANGTIAVDGKDVAVKGLGSAAYTATSAYATAAQGTKADNAAAAIATYGDIVTHNASEFAPANIDTGIHSVTLASGTNNGTVKLTVDGKATDNIAVKGLASAAYVTVDSLNATAKGYADAVENKLGDLALKDKITATDISGTIGKDKITNFATEVAAVKVTNASNADNATNAGTATKVGHKLTAGTKEFDGSADITITAADLGLTKIMNFLGTTSTSLADGSTTNSVIIGGASVPVAKGDVVLSGNKEFVFDGTNWKELGDQGSHALKTVTITGTGYLAGGGSLEANRTIDIATDVKTKIDNGATAFGWGNHASQGYAKTADLGDLAAKDKITATDISGTIGKDKITNFATEVAAVKVANASNADNAGTLDGHDSTYFATATQGSTADSALQSVKVLGTTLTKTSNELTVAAAKTALGLKSAAYTESSAYATKAQGDKADSALQGIEVGLGLTITEKASNKQTISIDDTVVFILNCN